MVLDACILTRSHHRGRGPSEVHPLRLVNSHSCRIVLFALFRGNLGWTFHTLTSEVRLIRVARLELVGH